MTKTCPFCGASVPPDDESCCPECLRPLTDPEVVRLMEDDRRRAQAEAKAAENPGVLPVGVVCPHCGEAKFRQVRPQRLVAFGWDRLCKACGTRYAPPTPVWGAIVFILLGLLLAVGGAVGVFLTVVAGDPLGAVCVGFLAFLGILSLGQGVRSLLRPGSA